MYRNIENLIIAPDGKGYAFIAEEKNGEEVVVKD